MENATNQYLILNNKKRLLGTYYHQIYFRNNFQTLWNLVLESFRYIKIMSSLTKLFIFLSNILPLTSNT